ncbi:protamine-like [Drosophila obscura]|uniref:protamine-like n=1 Tax=Drosophila obscura TaxID=7282 RepID=UPI000B9FC8E5|nr:protamine-like [Drosophila obscura]
MSMMLSDGGSVSGGLQCSRGPQTSKAFRNYLSECKRKFALNQVNVAAQRWRKMSLERRARYRKSEKSSDDEGDDGDSCGKRRRKRRSCSQSKRKAKKSSCAKRRRKKSACQKRKGTKKSCAKPRRKSRSSRRKSKC